MALRTEANRTSARLTPWKRLSTDASRMQGALEKTMHLHAMHTKESDSITERLSKRPDDTACTRKEFALHLLLLMVLAS